MTELSQTMNGTQRLEPTPDYRGGDGWLFQQLEATDMPLQMRSLSRSLRLHACWTRCPVTILEASVVATMCLKTCSKGTPAHLVFVNLSGVTMAAKHGPGASKAFQWNHCFTPEINLGSSAVDWIRPFMSCAFM